MWGSFYKWVKWDRMTQGMSENRAFDELAHFAQGIPVSTQSIPITSSYSFSLTRKRKLEKLESSENQSAKKSKSPKRSRSPKRSKSQKRESENNSAKSQKNCKEVFLLPEKRKKWTAYTWYARKKHKTLKKKFPDKSFKEIVAIVASEWKSVEPEEYYKWLKRAEKQNKLLTMK